MQDLIQVAPILVVVLTGIALLILDAFSTDAPDEQGHFHITVGIFGLVLSVVLCLLAWSKTGETSFFAGLGKMDKYAVFLNITFLFGAGLTMLASADYLAKFNVEVGEFYSLLLFATSGMMVMVSTTNMLIMFLGLEVMSLAFYILCGYLRARPKSIEASMKYFLMGAFTTGIVFYGIVLLYGISGPLGKLTQPLAKPTLDVVVFAKYLSGAIAKSGDFASLPNQSVVMLGVALVVIGFGFKVASVPFHMWAPDVYEGAPTTITGFMATGVKAAAFGAFVRIFASSMMPLKEQWHQAIWWMAVLSMFGGNLIAITQTNIKRMMAYSSIAHAGYMLIGLCSLGPDSSSVAAILYYLVAYSFMNLGVFAVISFLETKEGRGLSLDEYSGLGMKYPALCAALALFMLSLGGIPPTAGFMGKFYIFRAAIISGEYTLAGLGILSTLISLYYYLRVLVRSYMDKSAVPDDHLPVPGTFLKVATAVAVAGTLWLGFGPHVGFGVEDIWRWAVLSQNQIMW